MSHNNLYQLIHSLSKEEKRYFKLSIPLKNPKGLPKYVRLFNTLEKQRNYNEAILKQKKFNATDRNYLMEKLLESLVAFNKQKSIEAQLYQLLAQLPILYQKKLWSLLEKQIQQGQKMALTYEEYWFYLKLLEWELLLHMRGKPTIKQVNPLLQKQVLCIQQLGQTYGYRSLKKRIALLLRQNVKVGVHQSKVIDLLAESDLLNTNQFSNSLTHQIHFHQLKSRQAILEKQDLTAYQHIQQCKALFEENSDFRSIHEEWYQEILCAYSEVLLNTKQLGSFVQVLEQLKSLSNHSITTSDLICNKIHFKGLLYFLRVGDFDNCFLLIKDLQENWAIYHPLLKPSKEITYYYNIALIYLFNESWQEAYEWLDKILRLKLPHIREDLHHGIRILLLLLTYEIDKTDLHKTIGTVYKYFKRHEKYNTFEQEVVKHFKQLYNAFNCKKEKTVFVAFLAKIQAIDTNIPSSNELLFWCESKVKEVGLKTFFLEKING